MPKVNGKKYPYTKAGIQAAYKARYGSKVIPKYTNDPKAIQGQILKHGGSCGGDRTYSAKQFRKSNTY